MSTHELALKTWIDVYLSESDQSASARIQLTRNITMPCPPVGFDVLEIDEDEYRLRRVTWDANHGYWRVELSTPESRYRLVSGDTTWMVDFNNWDWLPQYSYCSMADLAVNHHDTVAVVRGDGLYWPVNQVEYAFMRYQGLKFKLIRGFEGELTDVSDTPS